MLLGATLSSDTTTRADWQHSSSINQPSRVLVVSGFHAGSLKANAINTVKMAEGFADNGARVMLVTRAGSIRSQSEFIETYSVRSDIDWYPVHRRFGHGLGLALRVWPIIYRFRPDVLFARNFAVPALTSLKVPTLFETHAHVGARGFWLKRAIRATHRPHCCGLITISRVLRDYYVSLGAAPEKIHIIPTGVDIDQFRQPPVLFPSPYNTTAPNVAYSGHLYDYKGIPTILGAATECPEMNFHLVGGLPEDIERVKKDITRHGLKNVHLHGNKKHSELPPYLWHADILLLPPSANHPSARWTSPVKLGEYMASGTPIIASDIPALRDLVNENQVKFVVPDDSSALSSAIKSLTKSTEQATRLASAALDAAEFWSYKQRAISAMSLISSCGSVV